MREKEAGGARLLKTTMSAPTAAKVKSSLTATLSTLPWSCGVARREEEFRTSLWVQYDTRRGGRSIQLAEIISGASRLLPDKGEREPLAVVALPGTAGGSRHERLPPALLHRERDCIRDVP